MIMTISDFIEIYPHHLERQIDIRKVKDPNKAARKIAKIAAIPGDQTVNTNNF